MRMKKITALLLTLTLALLCACTQKTPAPEELWDVSEMPRIDGSTATIPLSEMLAQDLLGYTPEQVCGFFLATTHL